MNKAGKGRGTSKSPWRPLYWMPILTILLSMSVAKLILWEKISGSSLELMAHIIVGLIGMLGAYRGAKLASGRRFLWGTVNAILYSFMLMLGNLFFFGEPFQGIGTILLWVISGGILGAVLANLKKSKIA